MNIFLSSSYHRRLELCGYRDELVAMGHTVTSRWLAGPNLMLELGGQPIRLGPEAETAIEAGTMEGMYRGPETMLKLARIDIQDIMAAECFINFTEPPESTHSRGGRHVELGFVLGATTLLNRMDQGLTRIIIVGYRENVFHWLPVVEFAETWEQAKGML